MTNNLQGALEAILFAAGDPLPLKDIMRILDTDAATATDVINDLEKTLSRHGRGLALRQVAGGFQLVTAEKYFEYVNKLGETRERRLTTPAMETLAVIAYKQPITKQEIEDIRGVRVERTLAKLLELELISEKGRKKALGRPILYGTTETFLKCFGLNDLDGLPTLPNVTADDIPKDALGDIADDDDGDDEDDEIDNNDTTNIADELAANDNVNDDDNANDNADDGEIDNNNDTTSTTDELAANDNDDNDTVDNFVDNENADDHDNDATNIADEDYEKDAIFSGEEFTEEDLTDD